MGLKTLPSFIEFSAIDNVYIVSPSKKNMGTYRIKIDVVDKYGYSNSYQFNIKVDKPAEIVEKKQKNFSWARFNIQ